MSVNKTKPFTTYLTCGVDAGNISVINAEEVLNPENPFTTRIVRPEGAGTYEVTLTIPNTWNGVMKETALLTSPSGIFVVGDACYSFISIDADNDPWADFLKRTGWLGLETEDEEPIPPQDFALFVNTGGDGEFEVILEIKFVS